MTGTPHPDRLAELQRAMLLITEAVEGLPNALLNIAAEAVARDVGCAEAGRIFARLGDLLSRGVQPPMAHPVSLTGFDA
jgi:hypothetical protein